MSASVNGNSKDTNPNKCEKIMKQVEVKLFNQFVLFFYDFFNFSTTLGILIFRVTSLFRKR